jgi:hypothetical protein
MTIPSQLVAVDGALVQNIVWVFDILAMMTIYLGAITIITPVCGTISPLQSQS